MGNYMTPVALIAFAIVQAAIAFCLFMMAYHGSRANRAQAEINRELLRIVMLLNTEMESVKRELQKNGQKP